MWREDPVSSRSISIAYQTTQPLSIYLIRWSASEDWGRNWRDTSVRVLSRTCGATMKVTTIFSCSRTKRVARTQKGLRWPYVYVECVIILKGMATNDNSYPKQELGKVQCGRCSWMTLSQWSPLRQKTHSRVSVQVCISSVVMRLARKSTWSMKVEQNVYGDLSEGPLLSGESSRDHICGIFESE